MIILAVVWLVVAVAVAFVEGLLTPPASESPRPKLLAAVLWPLVGIAIVGVVLWVVMIRTPYRIGTMARNGYVARLSRVSVLSGSQPQEPPEPPLPVGEPEIRPEER